MQAYGAGSFARGSPLSANRISSCASMTPVRAALSRIDSREMNTGRTPSEVARAAAACNACALPRMTFCVTFAKTASPGLGVSGGSPAIMRSSTVRTLAGNRSVSSCSSSSDRTSAA